MEQTLNAEIFISGLSTEVQMAELCTYFETFGTILKSTIKTGYAFLNYDNAEAASQAVIGANGRTFKGKIIKVERSKTAKGVAGACFKCKQSGHWSGNCPNNNKKSSAPQEKETKKIPKVNNSANNNIKSLTQINEPSAEQQEIINASKEDGINLIIKGCPGSGKTTTAILIARANPDKHHLFLTYNKRLKSETREKIESDPSIKMECHSYRSFYYNYFSKICKDEKGLNQVLKDKKVTPQEKFSCNVIIIDEIQDCTLLYYEAILNIIKYMIKVPKIIVIGDSRQSLYDYKGSSNLFLEQAKDVFFLSTNSSFKELSLKYSFRLTKQIAGFINECLLGEEVLRSQKEGEKVRYVFGNIFESPLEEVEYYVDELKVSPNEIFILVPSLRVSSAHPLKILENCLSKKGRPIFVPLSDEHNIKESEIREKIAILTFHQSKGLERDVVIVFNFDSSYFKFYNKNKNKQKLPKALYVAITRARKHLTVFHDRSKKFFKFIDEETLVSSKFCNVIYKSSPVRPQKQKPKNRKEKNVTNFISQVPEELASKSIKKLKIEVLRKLQPTDVIYLNNHMDTSKNTTESVAEITGIAIRAFYELKTRKKLTFLSEIKNKIDEEIKLKKISTYEEITRKSEKNSLDYKFFSEIMQSGDASPIIDRVSKEGKCDYLFIFATIYHSIFCENHKNFQIQFYDCLTNDQLDIMTSRLEKVLPIDDTMSFEYRMVYVLPKLENHQMEYVLLGNADIVSNQTEEIWELKCCSELTNNHILQLAVYMTLYNNINKKLFKGKLFNIRTNELLEVRATSAQLNEVTMELLKYKLDALNPLEDQEYRALFIKECLGIRNEYSFPV